MTHLNFLSKLLPILYPSFYSLFSKELDELVFLNDGNHLLSDNNENGMAIGDFIESDKTKCEATNNHFHLFSKVGEAGREIAISIGTAIARNLQKSLSQAFPLKKFIVYLEVNIKDSTIIRFHQVWANEPSYFDLTQTYQDGLELFEFRN